MNFSARLAALALVALTVLFPRAAARADQTPITTLDPQRYIGRWYEIARTPNRFQDKCTGPVCSPQASCATATSDWTRQPNGQFNVIQTCHIGSPSGPAKVWRGAGRVLDPATAVFRIGFFGGFISVDYKILDRAEDYSWCILTNGNPKFVWIMSKRPLVSTAQKTALIDRAKRLGFNIADLVFDAPAGG